MSLEVRQTPREHKYMIEKMMPAYLQELEGYRQHSTGAQSPMKYHYLKYYWSEAGRIPFTIWFDGSLAGFVLVRRVDEWPQVRMSIAEFYILPESRRQGIGEAAVLALWKQHPGQWVLQAIKANRSAVEFWRHTISKHAKEWHVEQVHAADGPRLFFHFEIG